MFLKHVLVFQTCKYPLELLLSMVLVKACVRVSLKRKLSEGLYALQNPNLQSLTRNTGPSLISQFSGECNYVLLAESIQTLWPKTSAFQLGVFKIKRRGRGRG